VVFILFVYAFVVIGLPEDWPLLLSMIVL